MQLIRAVDRLSLRAGMAFAIAAFAGCNETISSPGQMGSANLEPALAKAPASEIKVSAARPDSAVQGTTLDVTVTGSGFTSSSVAEWALRGVRNPDEVRTNSTRYVSSRELVANITVSSTATIDSWDIIVMAGPKTGIGTELFEIKATGNVDTNARTLIVWDSEVDVAAPGAVSLMAPAGIQGDGRDRYGQAASFSEYQGDFCGVRGRIYWNDIEKSGSGDLVFDPDLDYSRVSSCKARTLFFHLSYMSGGSPGPASSIAAWTNAREVIQLAGVGDSRSQMLRFWYIGLKTCDRLEFDATRGSGTANVRVTRLADTSTGARRWRVESEYPHIAMCTIARGGEWPAQGTRYLPFGFTATEVPYPYPVYR